MSTPNQDKKIRVYIVDENRMERLGLSALLEKSPRFQVIGAAALTPKTLGDITQHQPDVVLLEPKEQAQEGSDLCQKLKRLARPPRILVVTSAKEAETSIALIGSGADGYVLNDSPDEVLLSAVTLVSFGLTVLPKVKSVSLKPGSPGSRMKASPEQDKLDQLSAQQRRILELVAEGLTNKEIGARLDLKEKSIRNQVSIMMRKLAVARRAQAAAYYTKASLDPQSHRSFP